MELTIEKLNLATAPPAFFLPTQEVVSKEVAVSEDKNSITRIAIRQRINEFQDAYEKQLIAGNLIPVSYKYTHHFSENHEKFNCAMYGRELSLPAGAIIVGKVHKYPVMNVLLKGKLVVVSDTGRKILEAPSTYMSESGSRRVGYVLQDCIWLNIVLTDKVGEEYVDEIVNMHTASSYADVGLLDSIKSFLEQHKDEVC